MAEEYDEFVVEDYYTVKLALEKGMPVNIVMGPLTPKRKELLKGLLEKYPSLFTCRVAAERPQQHMFFISAKEEGSSRLMLEEQHPADRPYNYAYPFENLSEDGKVLAEVTFQEAAGKAKLLTLENIDFF